MLVRNLLACHDCVDHVIRCKRRAILVVAVKLHVHIVWRALGIQWLTLRSECRGKVAMLEALAFEAVTPTTNGF